MLAAARIDIFRRRRRRTGCAIARETDTGHATTGAVVCVERFIVVERIVRCGNLKRNEGIVGCPRRGAVRGMAARDPPIGARGSGSPAGATRRFGRVARLRLASLTSAPDHHSSSSTASASLPAPSGIATTPSDSRMRFSISRAISGFSRRNSRALSLPWPIFSPL